MKQKGASTTKAGEDEDDGDEGSSPFPKALQGSKGRLEEEYEKAARREWVHDRYQPESPARGSHRVKMERDSYRPVQEVDSYRPQALGENRPVARSGMELGRFLKVSLALLTIHSSRYRKIRWGFVWIPWGQDGFETHAEWRYHWGFCAGLG